MPSVVVLFFELDHMVPAVAEVIEIVDGLGAGLSNDIAKPRFTSIHGLVAVIIVGVGNTPMCLTSEELEEVTVRPAECLLKRQMQPIKAQRERHDKATHHLRFYVLEGHLDPDRGRVQAHAASLGSCACIV